MRPHDSKTESKSQHRRIDTNHWQRNDITQCCKHKILSTSLKQHRILHGKLIKCQPHQNSLWQAPRNRAVHFPFPLTFLQTASTERLKGCAVRRSQSATKVNGFEAARRARAHTHMIKMETVSGEETKDRILEIQHIPLLPLMKASPYLFFTKVWKKKKVSKPNNQIQFSVRAMALHLPVPTAKKCYFFSFFASILHHIELACTLLIIIKRRHARARWKK